jgi:hypothetical protein
VVEKNKSEYYTDAKGMRWFRSGDIGQANNVALKIVAWMKID